MKRTLKYVGFGGAALLALSLSPKLARAAATFYDNIMGTGSSGETGLRAECTGGTQCNGLTGIGKGTGHGVRGEANGTSSFGVAGLNFATGGGNGVFGEGYHGVFGTSTQSGGKAVLAIHSASSGSNYGVYASSASTSGTGVYGVATMSLGTTYGVFGESASQYGTGVKGLATAYGGVGVIGENTNTSLGGAYMYGVKGIAANTSSGIGVYASGGLEGLHATGGIYGVATIVGTTTNTFGENFALYAETQNPNGKYAGFFKGHVYVQGNETITGDLTAGGKMVVSGGTKLFHIDHPTEPASKYLNHASIESSEVLNLYTGNAQLDARGEAWVVMPSWFSALNKDLRYQLTAIGAPGPNLYIAEELRQNRFKIAGGKPGTKVSWQLSGVRHDPYIEQHPLVVEEAKLGEEMGTYIFPQGYGQPEAKSLAALQRRKQTRMAALGQPSGSVGSRPGR
jgi:hypothetical protein